MRKPLTDGAWLPVGVVLRQLGLPADQTGPQLVDAEDARVAAAAQVERARPDLVTVDATGVAVMVDPVDPDVIKAAQLLAARLYARKGSPQGLASYGDFGPAPVTRLDPDVERLLGVGRYDRPAVG